MIWEDPSLNIPSLLTLGEKQTVPYQTFDDLQLRRLLDDKTVRVLSYPAGREEILQRQEIFRNHEV